MSRKRMLSPDIWTDDGFLSLEMADRLLFIGLISHADDEGRGCAAPKALKAKVFPSDDVSEADILAMCARIGKLMRVTFYEFTGSPYYQLQRWDCHQYIKDRKPSSIPAPEAPGSGPGAARERPDVGPASAPNERKKEKKEKKEYAPGVSLSLQEHQDLTEKHGASLLSEAMEYLSAYKQTHGKHYPSDAGALRQFGIQAALERREKARGKGGTSPPGVVKFTGRVCEKCGATNTHSGSMCMQCNEELPRRAK